MQDDARSPRHSRLWLTGRAALSFVGACAGCAAGLRATDFISLFPHYYSMPSRIETWPILEPVRFLVAGCLGALLAGLLTWPRGRMGRAGLMASAWLLTEVGSLRIDFDLLRLEPIGTTCSLLTILAMFGLGLDRFSPCRAARADGQPKCSYRSLERVRPPGGRE
jgi:hypothetical protein